MRKISQRRKDFYATPAWKHTRKAYRQSVGGLCERCLAKGIVTPAEIVHHIVPLTDDNISNLDLALGWGNLQALCRKCHAEVHEEMKAKGQRYTIDEMGRVVIKNDTVF